MKLLMTLSLLLIFPVVGSASLQQPMQDQKSENRVIATENELENEQISMLNNGYAQMYGAVKSMGWTDKIFLIRFESDRVEAFGTRLTEYSKKLQQTLEDMAEKTPWMDLEDTGMPEIENMKLSAVTKDRIKSLLPVVGRSQSNFERTLLLSNSGALNQMQHLADVMLEIENDAQRRDFLTKASSGFAKLYEDDIILLNEVYFCHDTGTESKEFR